MQAVNRRQHGLAEEHGVNAVSSVLPLSAERVRSADGPRQSAASIQAGGQPGWSRPCACWPNCSSPSTLLSRPPVHTGRSPVNFSSAMVRAE